MIDTAAARHTRLQVGFGLGHAFLQAWHAWREASDRPSRLDFIALTPSPPDAAALRRAHAGTAWQPLAESLAAQWPPLTRNLHRLAFDDGGVHLLLAVGEPLALLPELRATVDDFFIDELALSSDPARAATRLGKGLARLAAPGARLHAPAALQALRPALTSAGFVLDAAPGPIGASFRPRHAPRRRRPDVPGLGDRHALIVGGGLAGCATAAALAEQGWRCTLVERHDAPAQEASGNPAGLFHGIVNPQDGAHARFNRAAALAAQRAVQQAIADGHVLGSTQGLLRLETSGKSAARMQAELRALHLPPDYVQALDATQASRCAGLPLAHPAWFYPGGGWVQPAALARALLQRAGSAVEWRGAQPVQALRRHADAWQLHDAAGQVIAEAATVVLANAGDALRLLDAAHWPVQSVRGQISLAAAASVQLPRVPLAGTGYLLPEIDGLAVFGASAQPGDVDAAVREADHAYNLQRLQQLSPQARVPSALQGRVGWRCVADDRLPLLGAVPDEAALRSMRAERLRDLPRRPGLYLLAGLASRGIAWSMLGAQVLAAQISGAPLPLEASLVDALDPARFALRAARRR
ncbi:MAG: FAD-dependent 5-carboxymethylaminomethyl-2-thiouridine(34) oxidoreductase MnmC [Rubrivivax sp.]|nr:FAD-dependent 5-carboxymethylaminomethyl-2-thiouridine(34) oxidoreductase MnmC [Rubrivivax sp.]